MRIFYVGETFILLCKRISFATLRRGVKMKKVFSRELFQREYKNNFNEFENKKCGDCHIL